jgi:nucleotide-binding universal stress UspA family protein
MVSQARASVPADTITGTSSIVVGVDINGRSASAVVWAVEHAEHDRSRLTLVSVRPTERREHDPVGVHDLGALARRLTLTGVQQREVVGDPVAVLLDAAAKADLLVVGCRTMQPSHRMIIGGTSRPVVRWSPVPVVVVPEGWIQPNMATAPVLAAVRPAGTDGATDDHLDVEVLDFAFTRAVALKVPVVVVSAWEVPYLQAWSIRDVDRFRAEQGAALENRLVAWRDRFPNVEVVARGMAEGAADAILDLSSIAQLVVMGRHHARSLSGLLGSTASHVLNHSTRPVAVVPAGSREELLADIATQRMLSDRLWGPTS